MITLYTYNTPNGRKISVALEEMGLPYEVKVIDITKGEQFDPEFLKIAPNNKIPAIVDTEGPDGQPISVFESGAILLYLAEKTGKGLPADPRGRTAVYEWLMWQMAGFGPMPGQVHFFLGQPEGPARDFGLERYGKETRRLYGVMDKHLAGRDFLATEGEPSIADYAVIGWAWRHERHQIDLAEYPNVRAWYDRMMARPGVARGFEVKLA
ncbi:glutathione S-transferase family protein [Pseudoroseomonas ludipueritiae]|uniref:Glutathione S-transferase N-terminal domain-containing protein n=1 Tax=Pseudoroseomonas ludipueritiae TaxID=198093 RepID=A0ABR7R477_9PROT|nr:glutathione binding-like protein [Pseudoroseomonas ludipueritiae]MBC9176521.1 glutathione S-transferase N-terminal domain-containing protein [Pseudoroseomonas ludipueritiae]MCG7361969.1 glutathione S-transferase N-terminal domain-containing protein [Roseomonas sp. ACRSG]